MRLAVTVVACAALSWSAVANAQSAGSNAAIEIGEASATTASSAVPSGPVVTIGEPDAPGSSTPRASTGVSLPPVYVPSSSSEFSTYIPYFGRSHARPVLPPLERERRRFRRMAIGGAVLLGVTTLVTAISAFVALGMRPSGVDLAQAWISFVPVVGTGASAVLEIAQGSPGGGLLAALLIVDALGQAAGLTMLVRGAMEPAPQPTPRRDVVRWQIAPTFGIASGIALTITTL